MRLIPTIITLTLTAGAALAQEAAEVDPTAAITGKLEGGELIGDDPRIQPHNLRPLNESYFRLGEPKTVGYEPLNINAAMQDLLNQACATGDDDDDRDAALSDCAFSPDFDVHVDDAHARQLSALVDAQSSIIELQAEAEIAKQRWLTAMLVEKADAAEEAAGIVVSAETHDAVVAKLDDVSGQLAELEEAFSTLSIENVAEIADRNNALAILGRVVVDVCNDEIAEEDTTLCDPYEGMPFGQDAVEHALGVQGHN